MIDRSMLIDALHINGLEPESSDEEIMRVLTAVGYDLKERNEALKIIRTKFPAPEPYVPEDLTIKEEAPKERIKIQWIHETESAKSEAPILAPIKIPWIHQEKKEEERVVAPLPSIKLQTVNEDDDKIKKALLEQSKVMPKKTFVAKSLQYLLFSDQLKMFSKDFVPTEEALKKKRSFEIKFFITVFIIIVLGVTGGVYFDKIIIFLSQVHWGPYYIVLPSIG